jgi:hypothetical protein
MCNSDINDIGGIPPLFQVDSGISVKMPNLLFGSAQMAAARGLQHRRGHCGSIEKLLD